MGIKILVGWAKCCRVGEYMDHHHIPKVAGEDEKEKTNDPKVEEEEEKSKIPRIRIRFTW